MNCADVKYSASSFVVNIHSLTMFSILYVWKLNWSLKWMADSIWNRLIMTDYVLNNYRLLVFVF